MVYNKYFQQLIYWGVWLIIPLLWEILIGFFSAAAVFIRHYFRKQARTLDYFPRITILIPVYNSETTLGMCLKSVLEQEYPKESLEVMLIDNGSKDKSFDIFMEFQARNSKINMWWFRSEQGKSKALNKGLFGSSGKYIVNIDSDGCLDKFALRNIVERFESNPEITCMTGVVLINPDMIENSKSVMLKAVRICELTEYVESFLVGRNFQSIFNSIYTLAGAFSCFRRDVILKTQMYNSETLGEDAHMTFQIKSFVGGKIELCENAFFYTDPLENLNKIYTQRQRWQRAELEVASLFVKQHIGGVIDFITKPAVRRLVSDHTLAFPRLIWFFGMIYLYFINYPLSLLIGANLLLYFAYVLNAFCCMLTARLYLKKQRYMKNYLTKHWYFCFLLPIYRFIIFWVRMAGIINSITTESQWRTKGFREEIKSVRDGIGREFKARLGFLYMLKKFINKE